MYMYFIVQHLQFVFGGHQPKFRCGEKILTARDQHVSDNISKSPATRFKNTLALSFSLSLCFCFMGVIWAVENPPPTSYFCYPSLFLRSPHHHPHIYYE